MFHICPVEIAAAMAAVPVLLVGYALVRAKYGQFRAWVSRCVSRLS